MDKIKNDIFILILYTVFNITIASTNISKYETSELLKVFNKPDRNDTSVYFLAVNEVNIERELSLVPKNVTRLCFILENTHAHKDNEYDITDLKHLQNLEELWITSKDSSTEGIYRNHYGVNLKIKDISTNIFLSKLKRLHINVITGEFWLGDYNYSFTQLRNVFTQLDVLDLSGVNLFDNVEDIHQVTGYSNNITALSLSGLMNEYSGAVILNLTANFGHYFRSSLQYLDMSHNYIGALCGSVIDSLPNLKVLDVSYNLLLHNWPNNSVLNSLVFETRSNNFQLLTYHPKIEIIIEDEQISSTDCGKNTPNTRRKRHVQYDNFNVKTCFEIYNISTVNELASVDENIYCKVLNCFYALLLNRPLTSMYLSCNFLPTFNDILSMLDFTGNCLGNIKVPVSPHLKEVSINHWNIIYNKATDKKMNVCIGRNSLEVLSVRQSSAYLLSSYFPAIFASNITFSGLDYLRMIDFSQNRLDMYLNVSLFTRLKVLTSLNISGNFLKFQENQIIQGYANLKVLDISANQISVIPFQSLANIFKLRQLYVRNNRLENLHMNITQLHFLQNIDLSDNKIRTFSADTIVGLKTVRNERLSIDLRNNHLSCICDEQGLATVELLLSADNYNLTFTDLHSYLCRDDKVGYRLLSNINIGKLRRDCKYPNLNIILGVTISNVILIMLITTMLLIYKFRYRLLTLCYRLKWRFTYSGKHKTEFPYDVFVSYSSKDILWMHDMLMLTLENMYGYIRLCVDYRDFLAGSAIVDAIIENINKSKIVIVILSENSLNSGYCEFELKIAHDHLLRMNKKLIIIKLGDLDTTNAGSLVKHLLGNRLYIEWPTVVERQYTQKGRGDKMEDKKELFWAKMRNVLYHQDQANDKQNVTQSNCNSLLYSCIQRCYCCSAESGNEDSQPMVLYENTQRI